MKLPPELLASLRNEGTFDQEAFVRAHEQAPPPTAIRINPLKIPEAADEAFVASYFADNTGFNVTGRIPWSTYGYYLERRPSFTFDPLFHAGCYYVQEPSSMFLEQGLKQLADTNLPLKVLDLCAAPGGKSTLLQSLLASGSLLVSNDVIRSRALVLKDNIIKWGATNVCVTNNDPSAFKKMPGYFDIMVVDAPCSGSGLFRKDEDAISEWSLNNVALCHQRQQRILSDALPSLKEGGLLIYSTCSYSRDENEDIADWLIDEWRLEPLAVNAGGDSGIIETTSPKHDARGYRFYPDKVKGEGFFISFFRNSSAHADGKVKQARLEKPPAKEAAILAKWLRSTDDVIKEGTSYFVIPLALQNDLALLRNHLNVLYKGVAAGEIMKEKLVPEHALAMSNLVHPDVPVIDLPLEEAIRYLQKQELTIQPATKGWQLVSYKNNNLGWINVLSNRINNYYPKESRILKREVDDSEK